MKKWFAVFLLMFSMSAGAEYSYYYEQIREAMNTLEDSPELASELLSPLYHEINNMDDTEKSLLEWAFHTYGLTLDDIHVDNDQDYAEVCLEFNRPVLTQPLQDWRRFVEVTPKPLSDLRYSGTTICFDGEWQTSYHIKIDGDLESDNRVPLGEDRVRDIDTGNRLAMLRFATPGQVLARHGDGAIAIESANINTVRLQLWHFPRETLNNEYLRAGLLGAQSGWGSWGELQDSDWLSQRAEQVYSGVFTPSEQVFNKTAQSNVLLADMLAEDDQEDNGFYLLNIWNDDEEDAEIKTLTFSRSQAGLSAYRTDGGLWVEVRDLATTKPLSKMALSLFAKSGELIATTHSDNNGMAKFSEAQVSGQDGNAPAHVLAENDDGVTYLTLDGVGFDLADKGLQGEEVGQTFMHWSWIDRGVYRPSDHLNALWLVKSKDFTPFTAPLWLTIKRPDGVAMVSRAISADESGAYLAQYDFADNAALGMWTLMLQIGRDGDVVSEDRVRVDNIMPQTLEASAEPSAPLRMGQENTYQVRADWLYGAPAQDVRIESNLRAHAREKDIVGYEGWQIGRHDEEVLDNRIDTKEKQTDAQGKQTLVFALPENHYSRALDATLDATFTPLASRPLTISQTNKVVRDAPYVALKANGGKSQIALVNDEGERQNGVLRWTLYDVNYHYYWYKKGDMWQLEENATRTKNSSGTVKAQKQAVTVLDLPANDDYRSRVLEVTGAMPEIAGSIALGYMPTNQSAPDRIRFAENKHEPYRGGDQVELRLFAPFTDGEGNVHLALDGIVNTLPVEFKDGIADVHFTWNEAWERGVWLLVSGYNNDQTGARNRRAVGLKWLGANTDRHHLALQVELPENIEPGQTLTLNLTANDDGWVNVAVIDDGLYQLGRRTFTNPLIAFFGQKRLPLSIYDVWGGVIRQLGVDVAKLRSGAGDDSMVMSAALADLPAIDMSKFIHFWSKPVRIDGGKATLEFPIDAQFNGRLRIMASAYNEEKNGVFEDTVTVRAPLVAELRTPTYLTKGDKGKFYLYLHNTTEVEKNIQVKLNAKGLTLGDIEQEFTLQPEESSLLPIDFNAEDAGDSNVEVDVQSHDIYFQQSDVNRKVIIADQINEHHYHLNNKLTVRRLSLPQIRTRYELLDGQAQTQFNLPAGTTITPSGHLPWSARVLADKLYKYPYSCSEQITSRLSGLDYYAQHKQQTDNQIVEQNIQAQRTNLFNTLLNRQKRDGGFALWSGGYTQLWLSAYVGETVLKEAEPPFSPDSVQKRLLTYLRQEVLKTRYEGDYYYHLDGVAYAHLLLARYGADLRGALIRESERLPNKIALSPISLNFALAFVAYGDSDRAIDIINRIDPTLEPRTDMYGYRYDNKYSRDGKLLVRLSEWQQAMPDQKNLVIAWQEDIIKRVRLEADDYLSTQGMSWLLRAAAHDETQTTAQTAVMVNDNPLLTPLMLDKETTVAMDNANERSQYVAISEPYYAPSDETEEKDVELFDLGYASLTTGKMLTIDKLALNERFRVRILANREYVGESDIVLVFPLPAGVSVIEHGAEDIFAEFSETEWVNDMTVPVMEEVRDDRYIAVFHLDEETKGIDYSIFLKADREGQWHSPAIRLEDMYRPNHFARGKAQTWKIGVETEAKVTEEKEGGTDTEE